MRRTMITLSGAFALFAFVPASGLARHTQRHGQHHHQRTSLERFGAASSGTSPSSTTAASVGIVRSLQDGTLTIVLNDGSTVSGNITGNTDLACVASGTIGTEDRDDRDQSDDSNSGSDDTRRERSDDQSSGEGGDSAEQNDLADNCSISMLTPGAVVHDAELRVSSVGKTWKKIEFVV